MSGGSYDYAYGRIEDLAQQILPSTPLRRAFKTHLHLVAKAAHEIEWVDSGDCAKGDEDEAIRDALGPTADSLELQETIKEALRIHEELTKALVKSKKK